MTVWYVERVCSFTLAKVVITSGLLFYAGSVYARLHDYIYVEGHKMNVCSARSSGVPWLLFIAFALGKGRILRFVFVIILTFLAVASAAL